MLKYFFTISCYFFGLLIIRGQTMDTIKMDEILVSATKTDRSLISLPLPAQLIGAKEISIGKYAKLQSILGEQSGLIVVPQINGLGNGIQVQGLNPDYTLIMIDGEPLIGRYTGSLELSRVSVGDIKKIEIVKGPSSSLYGSDALAGVINIITNNPLTTRFGFSGSYNTYGNMDLNLNANVKSGSFNHSIFINRFQSPGFDLSPNIYGQTVSPFVNYTFHHRLLWEKNGHKFSLSTRYFTEAQQNEYQVIAAHDSIKVFGTGNVKDFSLTPKYSWKINKQLSASVQCYFTSYQTNTELKEKENNTAYYNDDFHQKYIKPELQIDAKLNAKQQLVIGNGLIKEMVNTNRYGANNTQEQHTYFSFIQHAWDITSKLSTITGVRYDYNSVYHNQWSPKFAVLYKFTPNFHLKTSIGKGFKAPDFRQLYLNFNNAAAAYSVYGTEVLKDQLNELMRQQQIQDVYIDIEHWKPLKAENSTALNFGLFYKIHKTSFDINYFRNDLNNLIEVITSAQIKDNRYIYSYGNLQKVFTTGLETIIKHKLNDNLECSASYQLLYAKDKMVQKEVDEGKVYGRDPNSLETYRLKSSDYFGLSNRSRHQATAKLFFQKNKWDAALRFNYRGKFALSGSSGSVTGTSLPTSDTNSNGILDSYDNFVKAYLLCNITFAYHFNSKFAAQINIDNLLNHTDPINIPNLQGRSLQFNLQYQFIKSK